MNNLKIKESFEKLKLHCESEKFKGWDPFDGLNSKVFQNLPLLKNTKFFKLAWLQFFKRTPFNLRKIVLIEKEHNSKGLALFLIGYCNLYKKKRKTEYLEKINYLVNLLLEKKVKGYTGACWGYNFDWQARAFFQPCNTPTVVATSFVTESLIEAYNITKDTSLLSVLKSIENFVLNDLNRSYDDKGNFTLSYSPLDHTQVFNAGLLGVKTLCLLFEFTNNKKALDISKKIVTYVCERQNKNGSWAYGTLPFHQWIDSFHTGYNLECIYIYQKTTKDISFKENLEIGTKYYLKTFFTSNGVSKYYSNKTYPIDVHAPAQLIVTLSKLDILNRHRDLIDRVLIWTIDNMQSPKGYFYYQKNSFTINKIPYMRWTQAWMFYAFSYYFLD